MRTIKIGSGTTFNFTIPLDKDISEYENILVSLYTDANKAVRFSYLEKEGFQKMEIGISPDELVGVLTSQNTSEMRGYLWMVMKAIDELTPDENIGNSIPTPVTDAVGHVVELIYTPLSKSL